MHYYSILGNFTAMKSLNIGIIIILLFQTIIGVNVIDYGHNWGGDFALYIDESRSIIEGHFNQFYEQNLFTVNNSHKTLAPIAEPIGTPLILAPFLHIFGVNCYLFKFIMLFFYVGISFLLWKILDFTKLNTQLLKFCTILFIISYWEFAFLLETVNSDLPFTFFSLLSIYNFTKYNDSSENRYLHCAIATGTITYFIRDAGAALSATYMIIGFINYSKEKKVKKLLLFSLPVIAIILFKITIPSFNINLINDHITKFNYTRFISPLNTFYKITAQNILPLNRFYNSDIYILLAWLTIAFGTINTSNIKTSEFRIFFCLFYSGYLAIYMLVGGCETRFFLILEILSLILFCNGILNIFQNFRIPKIIISSFFLLLSILGAAKDLVRINNWCFSENYVFRNDAQSKQAQETWAFIKNHTSSNDVIFFRKPTVLRLFTRRNTCVFLEDSIFTNRPKSEFYQLDATCGRPKDHTSSGLLERDTIYSNQDFKLIKLRFTKKINGG